MDGANLEDRRTMAWRWMKFNSVGVLGVGVQLTVLTGLTGLGLDYLAATGLAVETAVVHNFLWHERWTWADRMAAGPGGVLGRLLRFNLTTGAMSILGNLFLMRFFVGTWGAPVLVANLTTIALCSIFNFLLSDRWVFLPSLWKTDGAEISAAIKEES